MIVGADITKVMRAPAADRKTVLTVRFGARAHLKAGQEPLLDLQILQVFLTV